MGFQAEVTAEIVTVITHIAKVETETRGLLDKIAALEEVIGQEPELISQELADAITALKAQVKVVDDLVPDVTVEAPFVETVPTEPPAV